MSDRSTRRRGAVLEQAILDAAWAELTEGGWDRFSVENVAVRAGTAKSVVYRRWPNRVHLAQEMLQRATDDAPAPLSVGELRADLIRFLAGMAAFLRGPFGATVRSVVAEGDASRQVSLFRESAAVAPVAELVAQAVSRGELTRAPCPLAVNVGHALVMSEFLHTGEPPDEHALATIVDVAWLPALGASTHPTRAAAAARPAGPDPG